MNPKRLIFAIVAIFVATWVTDFLIHGIWLKGEYAQTASLWRPEAEMQSKMIWLMLGQFLFATMFVVIYSNASSSSTACLFGASLYGICMALLCQANTLITYAVQPIPGSIATKWFLSGLVQGEILGVLVFFVYKPKVSAATSSPQPELAAR